MKEKILIIGSNGILGKHLVKNAIKTFGLDGVVISDYKAKRLVKQKKHILNEFGKEPASRIIDVHSEKSIKIGLINIDCVLIAIQQKEPLIQKHCLVNDIHSIDLSVNPEFISKTLALNNSKMKRSLQIITGGLFPGLSGILAKEINNGVDQNQIVDIGLLQSANGTNGKTGVSDMLLILDKPVELLTEETVVKYSGYSHKKKFNYPMPFNVKTLRLVNFIERDYLLAKGIKSNYWTSFDKENLNKLIRILKKLGVLKLFHYPRLGHFLSLLFSKQNQGVKSECIALSAQNSVNEISIVCTSDYEATAACGIAFTKSILKHKEDFNGVKFPFEIFAFGDIKSDLQDVIIEINGPLKN